MRGVSLLLFPVVVESRNRETSGKMIKVIFGKSNRTKIVRRQVYFFQAKLASCTASPQTQIYAWGIDPKVRFPLFLAILESKRGG